MFILCFNLSRATADEQICDVQKADEAKPATAIPVAPPPEPKPEPASKPKHEPQQPEIFAAATSLPAALLSDPAVGATAPAVGTTSTGLVHGRENGVATPTNTVAEQVRQYCCLDKCYTAHSQAINLG